MSTYHTTTWTLFVQVDANYRLTIVRHPSHRVYLINTYSPAAIGIATISTHWTRAQQEEMDMEKLIYP